ncbi:MAG TPA: VWA domain-containing protein [Candidatus Methanoperedens sp.]
MKKIEENDSDRNISWSTEKAPDNAGMLVKEGPKSGEDNKSSLWILDSSAKEKRIFLEMPTASWARLELQPVASGNLRLLCRYPTGSIDNIFSGPVEKGYIYRIWYQSEAEGSYELWYTLDGYGSNAVTFRVIQEPEKVTMPPSSPVGSFGRIMLSRNIGFSAGGAKDIGNFRENIEKGYLPLPTDVTFEGLAYGYYFQTAQAGKCKKLFCPSYSYAVSRDPLSGELQHYLYVGLNSGVADFRRNKLNLVLVLDRSGSMSTAFNQYYYDRYGNRMKAKAKILDTTKMKIASQTVVNLLNHLKDDDRFGLIVFSDNASVVEPLTPTKDKNMDKLREKILEIREYGGTNMEAGMRKGTQLLWRLRGMVPEVDRKYDPEEYADRIIFLTDAMPNTGETREEEMLKIFRENAAHGIYITLIGIGVDFNTELVESMIKIQGANYYSIHSADEFKKRMDEEFDYLVTPLVFDMQLHLDAPGYKIEKVYGSPEADEATGEIMKVSTLFPSKVEQGKVKGGVVLIKLRRISSDGRMRLKVAYKDQEGKQDGDEAEVETGDGESELYQGSGIQKAILLSRYGDLIKNWLIDERRGAEEGERVQPSVTLESGIVVPVKLGKWERQSTPLHVSEHYKNLFKLFGAYFKKEMKVIGDKELKQENAVLERLSSAGD